MRGPTSVDLIDRKCSEVSSYGSPKRRILVIGCSGRKRPDSGLVPAVDRYDSPSFRVLRRYLASDHGHDALGVFILSAAHGLIDRDRPVALYDRQMTVARADELRSSVISQFAARVWNRGPVEVLLCCGRTYRLALDGCQEGLPEGSTVRSAPPRPGERLAYLHDWLYGRPPVATTDLTLTTTRPVTIRLRGVRATLTGEEVLERGRRALTSCDPPDARPSTWTVHLEDAAVSPKWLVGTCFGLRRSAFGTGDALRVLNVLGIPVQRSAR